MYISRQGSSMYQVFLDNSYNLMHQSYRTQVIFCTTLGDLECSGACLSEKRWAYDLCTLVTLLGPALHLLELLAVVPPGPLGP